MAHTLTDIMLKEARTIIATRAKGVNDSRDGEVARNTPDACRRSGLVARRQHCVERLRGHGSR
jgi:hypothetical protein